jgi:hypothetical protein
LLLLLSSGIKRINLCSRYTFRSIKNVLISFKRSEYLAIRAVYLLQWELSAALKTIPIVANEVSVRNQGSLVVVAVKILLI